ncbi:hypothetical protein MIND_00488200 [Mycena indigotica]|uniref:Uncharacterized protein n=1 Tax=Mycena indigotica TaxID=2126181 RepID=A0A8H6WC40_9AGAR|nr:uncharacterized protein MIND_00488200 [Mycena indigotica]KAF7306954.1 hypothetical protein MIND_00488200 [Mycena indigotica]
MITGISKATTLYLAPVVTLTAIVLSLLVFLAPVLVLQDKVALLTVTPSTVLVKNTSQSIDGPTVYLGTLGSCSRPKNDAPITCSAPSFNPVYDLSVLPSAAPRLLLAAPNEATPIFVGIAIVFSVIFFITFTLTSFRQKFGEKMSAALDKPGFQRGSTLVGVIGFILGITSFLFLRLWFAKAASDFNQSIALQGANGPQVIANMGNAFTMVWVAYAFYGVPVVISLAKLHVKASK